MKRRVLAALPGPVLMATLAVASATAQVAPGAPILSPATDAYAAHVLAGISNHGRTRQQPYVTAGDRTYLIGTQDGNFPDMGQHIPGEMGGLWLPPVKLVDGFQARIAEPGTDKEILLSDSTEMVAYPYGNLFRYGRLLDNMEVDRFQFSPDHQQGLVVQYRFRNTSDRARTLRLQWDVKTDLRPGWHADHLRIRDGQDVVDWRPNDRIFIARDTANNWFCVWGAVHSAGALPIERPQRIQTRGRGVTAASEYTVTVDAHATSTRRCVGRQELPVGTNLISFSRTRTREGVEYDIGAKESGWNFVLRDNASPDSRYFLNGKPTYPSASGIRVEGRKNRIVIITGH